MTPPAITAQEKRLTIIALMVVFLLSALDQTIVSTAMPKIIEQLKGLELYAWVTTAYMLTCTFKASDSGGTVPTTALSQLPAGGGFFDIYAQERAVAVSTWNIQFIASTTLVDGLGAATIGNTQLQ